jgi:RsiW-degrading membrane proteinase PrsW (M82 family)
MSLLIVIFVFLLLGGGLLWFFVSRDRGQKEPIGALWLAAGFGFGGAILAGFLEFLLIPNSVLTNPLSHSSLVLLIAALSVGAIEEACKFIPLAFFLYRKPYFNEHTDGIIYFALVGLGFGIPENILYSLQFGAKTGLIRIILTPFFHSATTALVGYFLIKSKLDHKNLAVPALAFVVSMLLHGLYDFGLFDGSRLPLFTVLSLMITVGVTASLFILYNRATEDDQIDGLSSVGHNSFCRSCGAPNPAHNLYCSHCGKRA